jgi:uncharacterized protein
VSTERLLIQGHVSLEAVVRNGNRPGGVVICHPHPQYGGSMNNNVVYAVEEGFSRAGLTTLRFNFRGVGGSTGRYSDGAGETEDVLDVCSFLKEKIGGDQRLVLSGYSFGAWITGKASSSLKGPLDLFLVAYPFSAYAPPDLSDFHGRVTLVAGSYDDICPLDDLLAFHKLLECDKHLKVIPTSHFFEGKEDEIRDFIYETYGKED